MLRAIILAAVLAAAAPAAAQGTASPDDIANAFFKSLQAGQAAKAYQGLWRGTIMERKQADVDFVVSQTNVALQSFGAITDWELMEDDEKSPSFRVRTYLVRARDAPMFFKLQFYRSPNGWLVYTLNFADSLSRLP